MWKKAKNITKKMLVLFLSIIVTMAGIVIDSKSVQAAQGAPVKINCGGAEYKDSSDSIFYADNYYSGGTTGSKTDAISGTSDANLYRGYRYGSNFSYNIPIANGTYVVNLKFIETYWTASGKRVFNVNAEGALAIDNLDIYSQAGKFKAYDRSFRVTVSDEVLNLNFLASSDNAIVSAIAIYADNSVFAAVATPFLLKGQSNVTNTKLQWSPVPGATRYDVSRSVNGGSYSLLQSVNGTSRDDYDLTLGTTYKYEVKAYCGSTYLTAAYSADCKPYTLQSGLNTYDNMKDDTLVQPNELKVGNTYYRFNLVNKISPEKGFKEFVMQTSTDDINYGNDKVVLSYSDNTDLNNCKLECITFVYHAPTNKIILWAHYENNADYTLARLAVASATPGENFVFHKSFQPFSNQSRDMSLYRDDDGSAYVISSANNNADFILYKLTANWLDVASQVSTIHQGQHREAPSIIKKDGYYYLFSSQPAGWYPSKAMYSSTTSIVGKWSDLRPIGNATTFSAQSGQVAGLKQGNGNNYAMMANRWMFGWKDAVDPTQHQRMLPITFSNGYAFFDFYENVKYSAANDIMVPVQDGRLISQGKTATSSSNSDTANKANDGDYYSEWVGQNTWPSTWTVDLSKAYSLTDIQISWWMMKGSEAYYQYKVEGSTDGINYNLLLDKSTGYHDYGFTTDSLSGTARYIRVTLINAKLMNNTSNWYTPQLYEVKVFGN
jgi:hypothetical protein